jgi:hypothetical protein
MGNAGKTIIFSKPFTVYSPTIIQNQRSLSICFVLIEELTEIPQKGDDLYFVENGNDELLPR